MCGNAASAATPSALPMRGSSRHGICQRDGAPKARQADGLLVVSDRTHGALFGIAPVKEDRDRMISGLSSFGVERPN